jgi:procollagen-lysine,2-oxoglutarate 5-dioxygenase, invertebrate
MGKVSATSETSKCPDGIVSMTYATHGGRDDRFCRMLESAVRSDVPIQVLGWGLKWKGLWQKLEGSYKAVAKLPPDCLVVFTDGYDVLFTESLLEIQRKFIASQKKMLFSSECGCW